MKLSIAVLAVLVSAACLTMIPRAEARAIRADTNKGNGWVWCTTITPCATVPTGLTFNPFGTDPAAAPAATLTGGLLVHVNDSTEQGPEAQTPCAPPAGSCNTPGWTALVPGLALASSSGGINAQVVFFDLTNNPSESVFAPNPAFDGNGEPIPLPAATGPAWEIEFNYGSNPTAPASLSFGGSLYTASASTLAIANLNEFVYYNSVLYAPTGWTKISAAAAAPEIDPASALGAFTLLAGCLAVLRGRRGTYASSRPSYRSA